MNAKKYLRQLGRAEANIKAKRERLAVLRDIACSPASPVISDMPKAPVRNTSRIENMVMKILELEDEIRNDEAVLRDEKTEALERIGRIPDPECQTVLISRYFKNETWEEIAQSIFYTERWIYKPHGRALQELDAILKEFS